MGKEEKKNELSLNMSENNNAIDEFLPTDVNNDIELKYQIDEVNEEEDDDIEVNEEEKEKYDHLDLDQINEEFAIVLENNDLSYIRPRVLR
ncbi:MAG: hypothetical protein PHT45_00750 [Bacteroidales bacterium]|nr:hypothetical protein [Bacteroidales bacterium]